MNITKLTLLLFFALTNTSFAHHSDAGIDDNSVVVLEGKVAEFSWRQPHVYFSIEVEQDGKPVVWDVQMAAVNVISRQGWSSDSLSPGDELIVRVNPAVNGKPYGKISSVARADGSPVAVAPAAAKRSLAVAESLHGKWTGSRPDGASPSRPPAAAKRATKGTLDTGGACTSGFDCFFKQNLVLTDAAIAAVEAYDPLSEENPEATCVGRPTPSALMSAKGYLLEFDLSEQEEKIFIRSEWFNEERTIWMDGRAHPDPSETLVTGHSIGHWEGDTLVVDTQNFDDHRSPYQIGVPSGSQKHVVERYTLSKDGTSMAAEYVLEDPEFLAEPLRHRNNLYYAPHMKMLASNCDPENTGRFFNASNIKD